jgi:hypothetical protein
LTEWVSAAVHGAVLIVGIAFSRSDAVRRLCIAALLAVALGMLFAVVESDGLHVVVAAQLQTWRWLWLSGVLSALLLPSIAIDCWHGGDLGRAAALSMLGALLIHQNELAALPAGLALIIALLRTRIREPGQTRIILVGAAAVLAMSVVVLAQDIPAMWPQLRTIRSGRRPYMVRIGEAQALAFGGLLPATMLALACWSITSATRRSAVLLSGLGAVLLLSVLTYAVLTWTHTKYPADRVQAFAPWRAAIPESAEVLWPDTPPADWFELGRASYWSLYQMAGMVFSRDVTMISTARESTVTPLLPGLGILLTTERHYSHPQNSPDAAPPAGGPCSLRGVTFYASWTYLGPTPYPAVAPDTEKPHEMLYLYKCPANGH